MRVLPLAVCVSLSAVGLAAEPGAPTFTGKPTATKTGDGVKIEFAVSRATDVAVYVEDAEGRIVRHLAAGVLGANAPAPLKAGSLQQTISWDWTDDVGRPLPAGSYRVRVCAGMKVTYAGTVFSEHRGPNSVVNVTGLAAGPDGRAYVFGNRWSRYSWQDTAVYVYRRDGSYEKTVKPFPAHLPAERLKAAEAFRTEEGDLIPVIHRVLGTTFYPYEDRCPQQMAVTRDGHVVLAVVAPGLNVISKGESAHLAVIDSDGTIPYPTYAGPQLRPKHGFDRPHLAVGADDRTVYLTGLGVSRFVRNYGVQAFNTHAVYRVRLPERGPAEVFFGDPQAAGSDSAHLNDPRGIACDGKGHLVVADFGNNRVVVLREQDAGPAGSIAVEAPEWVGVNPRTGELYVHSKDALVKFQGWQEPREVARVDLASAYQGLSAREKERLRLSFALDASADPPVIWMGRSQGKDPLHRCEDRAGAFTAFERALCYNAPYLWNLSVDPLRSDVACRVSGETLEILQEATGKVERVRVTSSTMCRLGPEGNVYQLDHWPARAMLRTDRTGKVVPFPASLDHPEKALRGRLPVRPSGTTSWERDFCVDRRGNIYVKHRGAAYHGLMTVREYAPDGAQKRIAIWVTSDGALGPRVDPRGNIYMGECIKPLGKPYPDLFKGHLPKDAQREYVWMYGSVVKFGPEGGAAWFPRDYQTNERKYLPYPFEGEAKLDPSLRKEKVSGTRGTYMIEELDLQGALWWRYGFAYLLDMAGRGTDRCHCTATDFDVDDFGRVFYPDQGRFRVEVLDTNGNKILDFGGYGNQDYCGPDSYVPDPEKGVLRPPRKDDPEGLNSPFAEPEIAFNWFVGLAVSDRYIYVADGSNRRVLRCKVGYAAETACPVK